MHNKNVQTNPDLNPQRARTTRPVPADGPQCWDGARWTLNGGGRGCKRYVIDVSDNPPSATKGRSVDVNNCNSQTVRSCHSLTW